MTTFGKKNLLVAASVGVTLLMSGASTSFSQTTPAPMPQAAAPASDSARLGFRQSMQNFASDLEKLTKNVEEAKRKMEGVASSTPDQKRQELQAMRGSVREFGKMLADGAPLLQAIDRFDGWVSAQIARLNASRETLGQEWVEQTLGRYKTMQRDISKAREMVAAGSKQANQLLKEMVITELRASELLMAEEAAAAIKELTATMENIQNTMSAFRERLREFTPDAGA